MTKTPEQVLTLLDKMGKSIVELTAQLSAESAARMAHRHVLSGLLANLDETSVKTLLDHLHEFIDATEDVDGPAWASTYREELDAIYQDMTDVRAIGR